MSKPMTPLELLRHIDVEYQNRRIDLPRKLHGMIVNMLSAQGAVDTSPFVAPPFDPKHQKAEVRFFWWSWHPNYPTWSRYGSKGYATKDKAWEQRAKPINSSLDLYHNKLVREGDGKFTVVADDPCRKLDVWWKIKKQREA